MNNNDPETEDREAPQPEQARKGQPRGDPSQRRGQEECQAGPSGAQPRGSSPPKRSRRSPPFPDLDEISLDTEDDFQDEVLETQEEVASRIAVRTPRRVREDFSPYPEVLVPKGWQPPNPKRRPQRDGPKWTHENLQGDHPHYHWTPRDFTRVEGPTHYKPSYVDDRKPVPKRFLYPEYSKRKVDDRDHRVPSPPPENIMMEGGDLREMIQRWRAEHPRPRTDGRFDRTSGDKPRLPNQIETPEARDDESRRSARGRGGGTSGGGGPSRSRSPRSAPRPGGLQSRGLDKPEQRSYRRAPQRDRSPRPGGL